MRSPDQLPRPLWPLIFGFALLIVAVAAATWISIRQQSSSSYVRGSLQIENQLDRVIALVTDAETGQRGYLQTGREAYLEPYLAAKRDLPSEIDQLEGQVRDQGGARGQIAELRQLANEKIAELESTIVAHGSGKTKEALAIVNSDRGFGIIARIRDIVAALRAIEQKSLQDGIAWADKLRLMSQTGLAIVSLLVVIIAALSIRDGSRRMEQLLATNRQLETEIAERKQATSLVSQLQTMEAVGQLTVVLRMTSTTCWLL